MDRQLVIMYLNDLQADNDFNTDPESQKNINIDIKNLMDAVGVTSEEIKDYSENN